jgi:Nucleotidyl transferase AbiEii toxin, Type IV TA system
LAERPENQRVLALLEHVDSALFREAQCWFGGGSAVSLRCAEFRVSRDVDFLCASRDGYRLLRRRVFDKGAPGLFARDVAVAREARADRYGIRLAIAIDGQPLKFEIVSEGRIELSGVDDPALPVGRLSDADLVAEKLLANDDRHLDDASLWRDALDLLALEHTLGALPAEAWGKARDAYGPSIEVAWQRALKRLRDRPDLLGRSLDLLGVLPAARAFFESRLAALPEAP